MTGVRTPVRVATALVAALVVGGATWVVGGWGEPPRAPQGDSFTRSSQPASPAPDAPRPAAATESPESPRAGSGQWDGPGRRTADLASLPVVDGGSPPIRVAVPGAGIDLPVVPTGVDEEGAMRIPEGSRVAAWYRFGPGAGAESGAAVVAAHVSSRSDGRGPFARLASLRPGARVEVATEDGVVGYEVVSVEQIAKLSLDTASLFDRTGEHRLHLVTCGGRYDAARNSYEDNVVVVARVVR